MFLWKELQGWPRFVRGEHGRTHTLPLRRLGGSLFKRLPMQRVQKQERVPRTCGAESHVSCKCGVDKVKKIRSTLPVATVNERPSVAVCVIKHNAGQIACVGIVAIVISH